jgi:hypothetical protein
MMVIDNKFNYGQEVYIKTDPDQKVRIVTAICARPGYIEYRLDCGTDWSWQPDYVISTEKNVILTTTN